MLPHWPRCRSGASASGERSTRCPRASSGPKHSSIISPHAFEARAFQRRVAELLGKLFGAHLFEQLSGCAQLGAGEKLCDVRGLSEPLIPGANVVADIAPEHIPLKPIGQLIGNGPALLDG